MQHTRRTAAIFLLSSAAIAALPLPLSLRAVEPPGGIVHHPDVRVEPWASEPMVLDPVALAFGADGACYVVEMRDYPLGIDGQGKPGGTVRRLRDTDGDGRADESVVFAEGLSFPTSVLPWGDGILVCAPPEVLLLEDTDGDGRADRRRTVLAGLVRGVTDSNANSLRFGIDGWIHLANGGNGGRAEVPGAGGPAIDLRGADLAFDPGTGRIRRTFRSGGGFGLVTDDAGHSFTTYNLDHLQERLVPIEQAERAGDVEPFAPTASISDHGESAPLFPVSVAATRPNHPEQAGRFSSAGGMGFIDGAPFSARLAGSVLVCDVVTNVVHRDLLIGEGASFRGTRAPEEATSEFLASFDPSFRPVAIEPGPDGALYLADMQRDVIEHPDYIPANVRDRLDLRAGADRGRIWRILPAAGLPAAGLFAASDSESLVSDLGHPFRWRRDTAHRLLVTRFPTSATTALRAAARSAAAPEARLRAWRILAATGRRADKDAAIAAADPSALVRETAVALAEDDTRVVVGLLDDDAPRVRFAAALALDGVDAPGKREALGRFMDRSVDDPWARRALFLAADGDARWLLAEAWRRGAEAHRGPGDSRALAWRDRPGFCHTIHGLAYTAAAAGPEVAGDAVVLLGDRAERDGGVAEALLRGLSAAWRRHADARPGPEAMLALVEAALADGGKVTALEGLRLAALASVAPPPAARDLIASAMATLAAPRRGNHDAEIREAIAILTAAPGEGDDGVLRTLLGPDASADVQRDVIDALVARRAAGLGNELVARWGILDPSIRSDVVARLVADASAHDALLGALERGEVALGELNLDLEQRRRLLHGSGPAIGARAAALFDDDEYGGRAAVVEEWLARLPADGDALAGAVVFRERCASCHLFRGTGHRVGPDLEGLSRRSVEDIVTHVLDPDMAINPGYVACVVETDDGRAFTGLLVSRAADAVTLKRPGGEETTLPAAEIADLRLLSRSLMPHGLEQGLSPAGLRDLVAYLQSPDP
jgi:putative membrane-bound dehydrogenase-like protein